MCIYCKQKPSNSKLKVHYVNNILLHIDNNVISEKFKLQAIDD